ncbi:MAG: DUF2238 domain-containing protein [Elusimicrobiales bacterium]
MKTKKYIYLISIYFVFLIWSGINPKERFTWFLEVFPALLGFIVLLFTFKKFRFTYFTYTLILIHSIILFIGGHYTYAEVPFFNTIKEIFNQSRNNYDKLGHFFQGFVPSFIMMELFLRKEIIKKGWLKPLVVLMALGISALYELFEWLTAIIQKESAESFLGTQGYIWDTQSDMFYCLIGSIVAILLSKIQEKFIKNENLL